MAQRTTRCRRYVVNRAHHLAWICSVIVPRRHAACRAGRWPGRTGALPGAGLRCTSSTARRRHRRCTSQAASCVLSGSAGCRAHTLSSPSGRQRRLWLNAAPVVQMLRRVLPVRQRDVRPGCPARRALITYAAVPRVLRRQPAATVILKTHRVGASGNCCCPPPWA